MGRRPMEHLSADLSDWEVDEALRDLRAGATTEAVAARYGISTKTLARITRRAEAREKEEKMAEGGSALRQVNDALLAELERLQGIDLSSPDELRLEISRAKAVEGIAKATTENANTVLTIARMQAERAGATHVPIPKMLAG